MLCHCAGLCDYIAILIILTGRSTLDPGNATSDAVGSQVACTFCDLWLANVRGWAFGLNFEWALVQRRLCHGIACQVLGRNTDWSRRTSTQGVFPTLTGARGDFGSSLISRGTLNTHIKDNPSKLSFAHKVAICCLGCNTSCGAVLAATQSVLLACFRASSCYWVPLIATCTCGSNIKGLCDSVLLGHGIAFKAGRSTFNLLGATSEAVGSKIVCAFCDLCCTSVSISACHLHFEWAPVQRSLCDRIACQVLWRNTHWSGSAPTQSVSFTVQVALGCFGNSLISRGTLSSHLEQDLAELCFGHKVARCNLRCHTSCGAVLAATQLILLAGFRARGNKRGSFIATCTCCSDVKRLCHCVLLCDNIVAVLRRGAMDLGNATSDAVGSQVACTFCDLWLANVRGWAFGLNFEWALVQRRLCHGIACQVLGRNTDWSRRTSTQGVFPTLTGARGDFGSSLISRGTLNTHIKDNPSKLSFAHKVAICCLGCNTSCGAVLAAAQSVLLACFRASSCYWVPLIATCTCGSNIKGLCDSVLLGHGIAVEAGRSTFNLLGATSEAVGSKILCAFCDLCCTSVSISACHLHFETAPVQRSLCDRIACQVLWRNTHWGRSAPTQSVRTIVTAALCCCSSSLISRGTLRVDLKDDFAKFHLGDKVAQLRFRCHTCCGAVLAATQLVLLPCFGASSCYCFALVATCTCDSNIESLCNRVLLCHKVVVRFGRSTLNLFGTTTDTIGSQILGTLRGLCLPRVRVCTLDLHFERVPVEWLLLHNIACQVLWRSTHWGRSAPTQSVRTIVTAALCCCGSSLISRGTLRVDLKDDFAKFHLSDKVAQMRFRCHTCCSAVLAATPSICLSWPQKKWIDMD